MNLKSTFVFTLLLAIAAIPAAAEGPLASETVKDVTALAEVVPATPAPADQEITQPPASGELPSELIGIGFIGATTASSTPSCEEIDGTPCTTSQQCGSCYPHPSCPLTPCYCGYGVCQCDI